LLELCVWDRTISEMRGLSQLVPEQDWGKTHTKASKNHNNVFGEERLALIRTLVVSLGCINEGMLWFLECLSYFVVNNLILLFVALVELLGLVDAFFYCLWIFLVVCV
jgi:hypothetical protein